MGLEDFVRPGPMPEPYFRDSEWLFLVVETEVSAGVVVADVFDHFPDEGEVIGNKPSLHVTAKDIAQQAAEVFVARVGEEGSAVGEHADELAQQAELREALDLACHAVELVVEPPSAAELHFAGRDAVLEIPDHGGDDLIVARIEIVDDRLGQAPCEVEAIKVLGQS